ncbi:MAG: hypothetical protein HKM24_07755 [Gammaproteobacteria bacterium]|nr:hypothetical protein [Gammaproteobacteria bacterium]
MTIQSDTGRWVVRHIYPTRQRVLLLLGVVAALLAAAALFEFGRWRAGYDRAAAATRYHEIKMQYQSLQDEFEDLERKMTTIQTSQDIDELAYKGVETTLVELREKVRQQQEELEFYRGIVSPTHSEQGLRIHDLSVAAAEDDGQYRLRLVLSRSGTRTKAVTGTVRLSVDGEDIDGPKRYDLSDITDSPAALKFSFKYYQDFEQQLILPDGFIPQLVHVVVDPKGKSDTIERTFQWPRISPTITTVQTTTTNG